MSDIVIKAENIGKKYTIGHQAERGGYTALRDVLAQNARTLWNKTKDLATGKAIIQGDTMEEVWALKDVSFEIKRGEAVGIIGRNGAGKSTLLKILSRVTAPTSGECRVKGRIASLLEVGTGFHPELTGRQNIFLNGAILGMTKEEIKQKYDEIVAFAELAKFIDTPVKRYSSGMYVRLAFAVAAHLDPEILLVDEVLAVGDVGFQKKCLGKMRDVAGQGRTVLFISHNMGAINNLCSRAFLFEKGKLVLDSTAEEATDRYLGYQIVESSVATTVEINKRMEGKILKEFPYIRPRQVALLDTVGKPQSVFDADKPINVSFEFECLRVVPDLRVLVVVVDKSGVPLYGSQNTDDTSISTRFSDMNKGVYRTSCLIPANTFGGKRLYLTIQLLYPRGEHIVLNRILEFEVRFGGYNRDIQYGGNDWDIYVWPKLNWQLETVHDSIIDLGEKTG